MRKVGVLLVLAALLLGGLGPGRAASAGSAVLTRTLLLARGADRRRSSRSSPTGACGTTGSKSPERLR